MPLPPRRVVALALASGLAVVGALLVVQKTAWPVSGLVLAGLALLAWRPRAALLVAAGLAPAGAALAVVVTPAVPWADLLLLTATIAWLLRRAISGASDGARDPAFSACAAAFGAAAIASALTVWWAGIWTLIPAPMGLTGWTGALVEQLGHSHSPLRQALRLAVGAGLAAAIAQMAREGDLNRQATRLLLLSVTAYAVLSVYRLAEVALRAPDPLARALEVAGGLRIAPVIGDPNALGALFLLMTPVAFDLCFDRRQRLLGGASLALLLLGAWLAGSRTTMAVTPFALVAVLVLRASPAARRRVWMGSAAILLLAGALVAFYPRSGRHAPASIAWTVRRDLGTVTARMLRDDPVFGVGMGQYQRRSSEYMPPSLSRYYAAENAHNQYFQIAGELGLIGLAPFLGLLALAIIPGMASARDTGAAGLTGGVLAMLAAWIGQHPLLDVHVGAAFWLALGLLKGRAGPWPASADGRLAGRLFVGAVIALAALAPAQAVRRARAADLAGMVTGASAPQRDPDTPGPFHSTASSAAVYLPGNAVQCVVPLRARGIPGEATVLLQLNHRPAGAATAYRGAWRDVAVPIPARPPWPLRYHRLDLAWADRPDRRARLDVGAIRCDAGR